MPAPKPAWFLVSALAALPLAPCSTLAQEQDPLAPPPASQAAQPALERALRAEGRPAPLKVIVRRPCPIRLQPDPTAAVRRQARPMEFFFVLPPGPAGEAKLPGPAGTSWYRVATTEAVQRGQQYGWVPAEDVSEWWHREAIGFLPRENGRQRVRFYADASAWQDGFTRFGQAPQQDEVALGREPESLGNTGFVMPVLESQEGVTLDVDGSVHDLYRVAFIAARPGGSDAPQAPAASLQEALGEFMVDIVFCVDGSGSMQPYIDGVREAIAKVTTQLREEHPGLAERFRFGLVTFSDPGQARVVCTLADGRDHARFLEQVAALDDNGGAEEGEDVLSGMKLAVGEMDWCPVGFKQVILVGDEAAFTPEHRPERNPSGLSIADLLAMAQPVEGALRPIDALEVCRVISTVEIQRKVNGEALDALRTRQFSELAGLGDGTHFPGEAFRFGPDEVASMRDALIADLTRRIEGARAVAGLIEGAPLPAQPLTEDDRFAGVPAPFREMIELLRPEESATPAVREAWVSSFDALGAATVSERFLVSRARLTRLQQVMEAVGSELDAPGVNPTVLVQMLQQRLAAMSIDHDLAPSTPLAQVFEIVGGLPIQTPLMQLTPEQVASMTPADRARVVDKLASMARRFEEQLGEPGLWFKLDPQDDERDALAFVAIHDFR